MKHLLDYWKITLCKNQVQHRSNTFSGYSKTPKPAWLTGFRGINKERETGFERQWAEIYRKDAGSEVCPVRVSQEVSQKSINLFWQILIRP